MPRGGCNQAKYGVLLTFGESPLVWYKVVGECEPFRNLDSSQTWPKTFPVQLLHWKNLYG